MKNFIDMDDLTEHLESLYDGGNHHGLIYFIVLLAESVGFSLPLEFAEISATDSVSGYT